MSYNREAVYTFAVRDQCWLRQFSTDPSHGRLQAVHLIPKQAIRRELWQPRKWKDTGLLPATFQQLVWDPRVFVPGCERHHFHLDENFKLQIPRDELPAGVLEFAGEWGLGWLLERLYAEQVAA